MGVNVRIWSGSDCARVTDMTYAGKRGKKCRTLRISGAPAHWLTTGTEEQKASAFATLQVMDYLGTVPPDADYDMVRGKVVELVRSIPCSLNPDWEVRGAVAIFDEEIRGIDAPRPKLLAGVEGKWSAEADEDGIRLADLSDRDNLPRVITPSSQTGAAAYKVAEKVWWHVIAARTMSEATTILRDAGARLHFFCAMD